MARASNTRRHWVEAHDTQALAQEGCRIILGLAGTYGFNVEIPDLQQQVLTGLMAHPLWHNSGPDAWVDWPSDCKDIDGNWRGLWPVIRRTFPAYSADQPSTPTLAVVWIPDRTGRPTNSWMVTDDRTLMWSTFELTFNDSRSRFNNDVEAAAQIMGIHSDAISVAMTEGLAAMWIMGEAVLNASIRFSDDINLALPADVKARFGWKTIRDAITTFQHACGASNKGTLAVGESLWDMYVDRLALAGLVP